MSGALLHQVTDRLVAPDPGPDRLDHVDDFERWDEELCGARDTINVVIDKINDLAGAVGNPMPCLPLPRLPAGSLGDYLITPLAGDYGRIRANADACAIADDAMRAWSDNFALLAAGVTPLRWDGAAKAAFVGQVSVYAVVVRAVGVVVARGAVLFDAIAHACEAIAVEVERVVVALAKVLYRLAKKIAKRFAGLLGLADLAIELLKDGLSTVTDVVDDIVLAIRLIEECAELVELVEAWVRIQQERLASLDEIGAVVESLPRTATRGAR